MPPDFKHDDVRTVKIIRVLLKKHAKYQILEG